MLHSWMAGLLLVAGWYARAAAGGTDMFLRIGLCVNPDQQRLEAQATIRHPPGSTFYLNEQFRITGLTSGGADVPFEWDRSAELLPYTQHARPVHLGVEGLHEVTLQYAGILPGLENGVNQVTSDLVELASYACWYPAFPGRPDFTFQLQIDLPQTFTAVTNARQTDSSAASGRRVSTYESFAPGPDLVVVASPLFRAAASQRESLRVEVLYAHLDAAAVDAKVERLGRAMSELSGLYGRPLLPGLLRLVCAPRGGWGYSRSPLLVVSEEYVRSLSNDPDGEARDFHGTAHELAHFWWMIADPGTTDDWMNEGLAEYSAFRLSSLYYGAAFQARLLSEYRAHAAAAPAALDIAHTPASSEARYVNRYEKTTLMFAEAASRFRQQDLDEMLVALHAHFARTRAATTDLFLKEAGARLGDGAQQYFRECLYRPGWQPGPPRRTGEPQ